MARPLRMERVGWPFHVTARGNDRADIYRDDPDRYRFLELLSGLPGLFGIRIHAYVLISGVASGPPVFQEAGERRAPSSGQEKIRTPNVNGWNVIGTTGSGAVAIPILN